MIPYGRQDINQADIDTVVSVLQSDFLTQGPQVPLFEQTVAGHVGAKHALAVNSATSALHIACLALGLGPGDWLWTTPVTFVASSNCGLYCGAQVDFVDIDPRTYNLCPQALEAKLLAAEMTGKLPKVMVAVHLCGQPCDMAAIHAHLLFRILILSNNNSGIRCSWLISIWLQQSTADVQKLLLFFWFCFLILILNLNLIIKSKIPANFYFYFTLTLIVYYI